MSDGVLCSLYEGNVGLLVPAGELSNSFLCIVKMLGCVVELTLHHAM